MFSKQTITTKYSYLIWRQIYTRTAVKHSWNATFFFPIFTSFLVASTQRLLAAWFETENQRDENQEESKQVTTLQLKNWDPFCPIVRKKSWV